MYGCTRIGTKIHAFNVLLHPLALSLFLPFCFLFFFLSFFLFLTLFAVYATIVSLALVYSPPLPPTPPPIDGGENLREKFFTSLVSTNNVLPTKAFYSHACSRCSIFLLLGALGWWNKKKEKGEKKRKTVEGERKTSQEGKNIRVTWRTIF